MKVLYILGGSRSGSTIVDNVLNEVDGFFSGGEIRFVWQRLLEGKRCGCRRLLGDCPIWATVLQRGFGFPAESRIDPRDVARWQRESLRLVHLVGVFRAAQGRGSPPRPLRAYADVAQRLYAALAETTGARVIVDSSKRATNAAMLGMLSDVSPYYVHLIRDPRAVAYSRQRRKENPEGLGPADMDPRGLLDSAVSWLAWNLTSEAVVRRQDPRRVMVLRYERFAADPIGAVEDVVRLVGEDDAQLPFVDETTVRLTGNHAVSGNPSRFVDGLVPIREDDEWRHRMSLGSRGAVTALTLPALVRYGYPRFGGVAAIDAASA